MHFLHDFWSFHIYSSIALKKNTPPQPSQNPGYAPAEASFFARQITMIVCQLPAIIVITARCNW